jgi:hypothetical protein
MDLKDFSTKRLAGIVILCTGGRGDLVNTEPALRYFVNKAFLHTPVIIVSELPELFRHLESERVTSVSKQEARESDEDWAHHGILFNNNHQKGLVRGLNQPLMHGVDNAAIYLLGYTLPNADKRVKLPPPSQEEIESFRDKLSRYALVPEETLLIHAGDTWQTRTIPVEWWDEFIGAYPYPVCLIGISNPTKEEEARFCNKGKHVRAVLQLPKVASLVNELSIRETVVAVSQCWGLITNDSLPVHIAGAFTNYLFTAATSKHWDNLKPYGHRRSYNFGKEVFGPSWHSKIDVVWSFEEFPEGVDSLLPYLDPPTKVADLVASKYEGL